MIGLCEWRCQLPGDLAPQWRGGQFQMEESLHDC